VDYPFRLLWIMVFLSTLPGAISPSLAAARHFRYNRAILSAI
jgi:hypothetical protein